VLEAVRDGQKVALFVRFRDIRSRRGWLGAGATGALALLLLWTAPSALAINSYHAAPATERAEVGALIARWDHDEDPTTPDRVDWMCSGTMIDADTFLTAAHCTGGWPAGVRFYVSLEPDVSAALERATARHPRNAAALAAAVGVPGTAYQDPRFPSSSADTHDIAVVELPVSEMAARWDFRPARLPRARQLDTFGPRSLDDMSFMVVGYGAQEASRGPGGHTHPGGGVRMKAPLGFDALNRTRLRFAMTASHGNGGACYGDSGGPNFAVLDGELVLVGTTITGDTPCYATNVAYRTDSPSARAFLGRYVDLP
jgi:hypothetical protein